MTDISGGTISSTGHSSVDVILSAFGAERNRKIRRISQGVALGTVVYNLGIKQRAKLKDRKLYTVSIASEDEVYPEMLEWVLKQIPAEERKSLTVKTFRVGSREIVKAGTSNRTAPVKLKLHYDGSRSADLNIRGFDVTVKIDAKGKGGNNRSIESAEDFLMMASKSDSLIFYAPSVEARDAVLQEILDTATEKWSEVPCLKTPSRYGGWAERSDLPSRSLDSVILREGQSEDLVADLNRFLNAEDHYNRLGLPWHRGYIFHGPPGTGKSSLARALAGHFKLDVFFASLADIQTDTALMELINLVTPNSILLLEDVDSLHAATSREDVKEHAGMSALLNALDGIVTPHGLITIMTTNKLEDLDPALTRPGRMDRMIHLDYLDQHQAELLAQLIAGREVKLPPIPPKLSAADIMEKMKPYLDTPEKLPQALVDTISELWKDRRGDV